MGPDLERRVEALEMCCQQIIGFLPVEQRRRIVDVLEATSDVLDANAQASDPSKTSPLAARLRKLLT